MTSVSKNLSSFTKSEVSQFFKRARCALRHPGLTILYAPTSKDYGRILVITARKVGNSPERNKIRRRLKAIFYENNLFERGYDCAIVVRKEGTQLSYDELKELLLKAFSKIS